MKHANRQQNANNESPQFSTAEMTLSKPFYDMARHTAKLICSRLHLLIYWRTKLTRNAI